MASRSSTAACSGRSTSGWSRSWCRPICKLIDKLADEWREDDSLPVQVARARIEALRTAGDPEGRFRAKWQLVRSLYDAGYNAEEVRELFRLIDWMMHLRADLEQRFRVDLAAFEEQREMPYVTSIERLACLSKCLILPQH
ncbi:MAG: hypothetical protein R6U98_32175 [Pirellulaceae bacterium]